MASPNSGSFENGFGGSAVLVAVWLPRTQSAGVVDPLRLKAQVLWIPSDPNASVVGDGPCEHHLGLLAFVALPALDWICLRQQAPPVLVADGVSNRQHIKINRE